MTKAARTERMLAALLVLLPGLALSSQASSPGHRIHRRRLSPLTSQPNAPLSFSQCYMEQGSFPAVCHPSNTYLLATDQRLYPANYPAR